MRGAGETLEVSLVASRGYRRWIRDLRKHHQASKATGSTVAHVNLADIRPFEVRIPPLAEQKAIVALVEELLSVIDAMKG